MKKGFLGLLALALLAAGCAGSPAPSGPAAAAAPPAAETARLAEEGGDGVKGALALSVDGTAIAVTWADNAAADALAGLAAQGPVTVRMERYGGFEQVGALPQSIARDDVQLDAAPGDIVLYQGDSLVLFYGRNTWAYTRLGHIDGLSPEELAGLLGADGVTVTLSLVE